MMRLLLASTSPYRRELLSRLQLPFEQVDPNFTEAAMDSMRPNKLVRYNTLGKARAVLSHDDYSQTDVTIIASDQIALCGSTALGKPGTIANACAQLKFLSGQSVLFLTGLAVVTAVSERFEIIPFQVHFRDLSEVDIETYVRTEQPLHCAGSFKSEGLGISLFERLEGDDPTALIGLPLIQLSQWLKPLEFITHAAEEQS